MKNNTEFITSCRDEYLAYRDVADRILADPRSFQKVNTLLDTINYVSAMIAIPSPIIFLDGSSGMGKTQMAMTLKRYYDIHERNTVYIYIPMDTYSEEICEYFQRLERAFRKCSTMDICGNNFEKMVENKTFFSEKWYIFGLIKHIIIRNGEILNDTTIPGITLDELKSCLSTRGKRLIMFCDNISTESYEFHFFRKMMQALGEVLIISSNKAKANCLNEWSVFRSNGNDAITPSIFVEADLPKYLPSSDILRNSHQLPPYMQFLLHHSRPRYAKYLVEYLSEHDFSIDYSDASTMNALFSKIGAFMHRDAYEARYWELGEQINTFAFFSHHPRDHSRNFLGMKSHEKYHAVLVDGVRYTLNYHMKLLQQEEDGTYQLSEETLVVDNIFPTFSNDALLHLCLPGISTYYPFTGYRQHAHTLIEAYQSIRNNGLSALFRGPNIQDYENTLCFLFATASCVASRMQGIGGINGYDFLQSIIFQLTPAENVVEDNTSLVVDNTVANFLRKHQIPLCSVCDCPWDSQILQNTTNGLFYCGHITRFDVDRIDVKIMDNCSDAAIVSGECKGFQRTPFHENNMKNILARVPRSSFLHIVHLPKLKRSLFQHKRYRGSAFMEDIVEDPIQRNFLETSCLFRKTRIISDPFRLENFPELSQRSRIANGDILEKATTLILFIEAN